MAHVGAVVIYTKAGRSALATVASGPGADGACDLDTGERVRPETIAVLQPDQVVEYHSASMNKWIPARVLRTGRAPGTFDLDCKEAVDKSRVRLPDSFVSALPGSAAGFGAAGGAKGAGPLGLADGQLCFYKSGTHGWLAAQVVRFRPEDGTYDLDIKQQANPSSVRSIAAGALVEYHSTSQDTWILARVLRARAEPGTWDLDCKEMVHMSRLRPSPEGTQVASQASMAGPPGSAPAAGAPVAAGAPAPAPWPSDPHLLPFDQRLGLFQGAGAAAQPADAPQAPGPRHAERCGRGDDTVGNPHRALISQFELLERIPLLKLYKTNPVEQSAPRAPGGWSRGKRLHTGNHKSEIMLENATENPLDNSSTNPLDK